jgi:ATP-binding cassette subfamily B multidrug efflux pump
MDPVAPPGAPAARLLGVPVPEAAPPASLLGFYWHFARQARALFAALFVAGLAVALLDLAIPLFIGAVIGLLEAHGPQALWAQAGGTLLAMAALLLIGRPLAILCQNLVTQQGIIPGVTSMIRWQSHWHVVRQGLPFFQEDFARRCARAWCSRSTPSGTSWSMAPARCWRWPPPMRGWRCRSCAGSCCTRRCCG